MKLPNGQAMLKNITRFIKLFQMPTNDSGTINSQSGLNGIVVCLETRHRVNLRLELDQVMGLGSIEHPITRLK